MRNYVAYAATIFSVTSVDSVTLHYLVSCLATGKQITYRRAERHGTRHQQDGFSR